MVPALLPLPTHTESRTGGKSVRASIWRQRDRGNSDGGCGLNASPSDQERLRHQVHQEAEAQAGRGATAVDGESVPRWLDHRLPQVRDGGDEAA